MYNTILYVLLALNVLQIALQLMNLKNKRGK